MKHNIEEAPKRLLFLCSGNYYRSRTAEYLFNQWAKAEGLSWEAYSYGLAENITALRNEGPISPLALSFLSEKGMSMEKPYRFPASVTVEHLSEADKIIALSKEEHEPMVLARFEPFQDQISYWEVHDIDKERPEVALDLVFRQVKALIIKLKEGQEQ